MSAASFKNRFCQKFHCSDDDFAARFFFKCLCPHATAVASIARFFNRKLFSTDWRIIEQLSGCASMKEITELANGLRYIYGNEHRALRKFLKIRISGKRMIRLASRVLNEKERTGTARVRSRKVYFNVSTGLSY